MDVWVGIEVTRQMRVESGQIRPAGDLKVGGVNLLEHQIGVAKQVTSADKICVLSPQGDERMLEIVSRHEVRELAPFDFIAMLSGRAKRGEKGAVVLLRQIAPLHDANMLKQALRSLKQFGVVVSASRPPAGHRRHEPLPGETEPDYRCLAFEVRRLGEFNAAGLASSTAEHLQFISWNSFAEFTGEGEADAARTVTEWLR